MARNEPPIPGKKPPGWNHERKPVNLRPQARVRARLRLAALGAVALVLGMSGSRTSTPAASAAQAKAQGGRPDILFILMDDVGIDQMTAFGWGGIVKPSTPNIDLLADAGVKFSNAWAMPECSPSRAAIFTGRYPLRTGVESALVENMLPQSQVSPNEVTLPRVLAHAGYTTAMVGKYHLGNFRNPSGDCSPATRGWDFFSGNLGADPPSIDVQAGIADGPESFVCGFDQRPTPGACYFADDSCRPELNGKACLDAGGIFVAGVGCQSPPPDAVDFSSTRFNGYYVWPKVTIEGALPPESGPGQCTSVADADCMPGDNLACTTTSRSYMTVDQTDGSVAWWKAQTKPRMLTVSYNATHTPFQQPSGELLSKAGLDLDNDIDIDRLSCNPAVTLPNIRQTRLISNAMFEGMDIAIGRLLEDLNLATLNPERTRITSLHLDNTLLVIAGDNGTFGTAVKPPFSPERSKGTVYETGVLVPLIVAGDLVKEPGRTVDALVNVADLFELFAEAAGVDVRDPDVVPASHRLDSRPLLPYLTNPAQPDIRRFNFTQLGTGFFQTPLTAPDPPASVPQRNWPCVLGSSASLDLAGICVESLIGNEARCEDNAGIWYGPRDCADPDDPQCQALATNCCDALQMAGNSQDNIQSIQQFAVRNREFKLVMLENEDCTAPIDPSTPPSMRPFPWAEYDVKTVREFYPLQPTPMNPAGIDRPQDNLLKDCQLPNPADCLPPPLRPIFNELNDELNRILNSELTCPGDGNLDKVVDQLDLDGVEAFRNSGPSFFDFNLAAETDDLDRDIVLQNFGKCLPPGISSRRQDAQVGLPLTPAEAVGSVVGRRKTK